MPNTLSARFPLADTRVRHRMIIQGFGEVGTGKTSFALGGPAPIVVQSLDKGLEGVVEAFARDKDIYTIEYDWSPGAQDFSQEYAKELRERFIEDYEYALEQGARTVIWDKETDVWELFRYAEFGKPSDAPKDYPKLNQRYKAIINKVKNYDTNFIAIQGMAAVWEKQGGKPVKTDRREWRGFDWMPDLVMAELEFTRTPGVDGGPSEFAINVGKARQNTTLQDQTYPGMTFTQFGELLVPGSTEEEWK